MGDGQIDLQAAAQGDTSGSVLGTFTVQYTRDGFHLLPQPLFGCLDIYDPALQFQFATDHSWQAQFGWTLLKHTIRRGRQGFKGRRVSGGNWRPISRSSSMSSGPDLVPSRVRVRDRR